MSVLLLHLANGIVGEVIRGREVGVPSWRETEVIREGSPVAPSLRSRLTETDGLKEETPVRQRDDAIDESARRDKDGCTAEVCWPEGDLDLLASFVK